MIRAPRRVVTTHQPLTPFSTALDYELTDSWPTIAERARFWTGRAIPSHLTEWRRPDPRLVLKGEGGRLQHEREVAEWKEARLQWLRERAKNG